MAIIKSKRLLHPSEPADRTLMISSELAEVAKVRDFVKATLEGSPLPERDAFQVDLSLVEVCINIVLYAYPQGPGPITLKYWRTPGRIIYEIRDMGEPFDPRTMKKPNLKEIMRTARKGGFGIFLSRKMMDGFDYRREGNENVLTLSKRLRRKAGRSNVL